MAENITVMERPSQAIPPRPLPVLDTVLGWMSDVFDGDLHRAAEIVAVKAQDEGYVSGALWDEIGVNTLQRLYRERIGVDRRGVLNLTERETAPTSTTITEPVTRIIRKADKVKRDESVYAQWVSANGKWYQLGDLTKKEAEELADDYDNRSKSNAFERDFYREIAEGLADGQTVRQRYTAEQLADIRKSLAGKPPSV